MTAPSKLLLTDRTSIETDWLCGMRYWWYKQEGGSGIVPIQEASYFAEGRAIHEDLSNIAEGVDFRDVIKKLSAEPPGTQVEMEIWQRRLGWLAAFGMYFWPLIQADWEVVKTEHEVILDRTPLWIAVTPDLLLRGKSKRLLDAYGKIVYKDYKSSKWLNEGWQAHWPWAVQVHLGLAATQEEIGEPIAWGNIVGLGKGQPKYGKLSHPYVYGYRDPSGSEWSPEWRRDWDKVGLWEYPGGILDWVEKLGEDVSRKQFVQSRAIFLDPRMLDKVIRQQTRRMQEIDSVRVKAQSDRELREIHFPERFIACKPVVGDACPYLDACFNKTVGDDPLASGLYAKRQPHHEVELTWDGGEEGE